MLLSVKDRIKKCCSKYKSKILTAVIIVPIVIVAFVIFFAITPKTSTIFYEGTSETAIFDNVETRKLQLDIQVDSYNGRIRFGAEDEDQMIQAVNQELLQNTSLSELEPQESERYQFLNEATLSSQDRLTLTVNMPDNEPFSYRLEIKQVDTDEGKRNEITISDFPREAEICVYSSSPINMKGTLEQMPAGRYLMRFCGNIQFVLRPPDPDGASGGEIQKCKLSGEISSFHIRNSERDVLEFTVDAQTEFREIGHIDLEGRAKEDGTLIVDISDLGAYPIPVTLSGQVGDLAVAGNSLYLTLTQWLRENMTQILLALIGVIFSVVIAKPSKQDPPDENGC